MESWRIVVQVDSGLFLGRHSLHEPLSAVTPGLATSFTRLPDAARVAQEHGGRVVRIRWNDIEGAYETWPCGDSGSVCSLRAARRPPRTLPCRPRDVVTAPKGRDPMNLLLRVTVAKHQARDPEAVDTCHVPLINCRYVDRDTDPKAQVVLGTLRLCGVDHFAVLVRVHETEDGRQEPVCDPLGRFADFSCASGVEGKNETIEVAGLPGEWVLHVHPYGR